MHDAVKQAVSGFPIKVVAPCEGNRIRNLFQCRSSRALAIRNPRGKFYDWALSAEAQNLALQVNAFQVMSNRAAEASPSAPDMSTIKLINYDFKKYGSSAERKRLLQKWDEEVSTLPQ